VIATPLPSYYVPDFDLSVNGLPIPVDLRASITGLSFDEALEGADRVELHFADPGSKLLEHPLLQLGAVVGLGIGYQPNGIRPMFLGDITGIEPSFPSGGMPSLSVSAHDFMHRLHEGTKQRGFPFYLIDSVIASLVAAENGLLAVPDPLAAAASGLGAFAQRPRFQHKQSDYDFLRQIANEYGFEMWLEGPFLNFKLLLRDLPPPEVALNWGSSLIEFSPRVTSIGQVAAVDIRVWVESLKTELSVHIGWDGERLTTQISAAVNSEETSTSATLHLPDVPHDSPIDAIKWAMGEMRRRINGRLTGHGSAVGDPRLRAGANVALTGLGPRFSGTNFRITGCSHRLDASGYRTNFDVRQELI
jgi:phage protein D